MSNLFIMVHFLCSAKNFKYHNYDQTNIQILYTSSMYCSDILRFMGSDHVTINGVNVGGIILKIVTFIWILTKSSIDVQLNRWAQG